MARSLLALPTKPGGRTDHPADANEMRDPVHTTSRSDDQGRDTGVDANELRAALAQLLDDARTTLTERLRPAARRSPLRLVTEAAAVGFVLGIVVPVRWQMLVVAPAIRAGMKRVLAATHPPSAAAPERAAATAQGDPSPGRS